MRTWAYALVVAAAVLWGIISIFVKKLAAYGLTTLQIVAIRVVVSAIILALYIAIKNRSLLKIRPADGKYFIGTGVFSIAFFNWCYFTAIRETSVAVAAILLYTAPAFVLLLSRLFFGEKLTNGKIAVLAIAFSGCALVVGILPGLKQAVSISGLASGLGAGFGYALYSIFGKFALRHYHAVTVTVYTFVFAAVVILPVSGIWEMRMLLFQWTAVAYSIGFSLFSTVFAYLCYTVALSYIEPGRAAIVATLEPIVATIVGVAFFGEALSNWQLLGIVLVIAAVASVQWNSAGAQES